MWGEGCPAAFRSLPRSFATTGNEIYLTRYNRSFFSPLAVTTLSLQDGTSAKPRLTPGLDFNSLGLNLTEYMRGILYVRLSYASSPQKKKNLKKPQMAKAVLHTHNKNNYLQFFSDGREPHNTSALISLAFLINPEGKKRRSCAVKSYSPPSGIVHQNWIN